MSSTEQHTEQVTEAQAEAIAGEAVAIIEVCTGPDRLPTADQLAACGLDHRVIDAAVKGTIVMAGWVAGPEKARELHDNPALAMLIGATLAASALNLKSGAVVSHFADGTL